MARAQSPVPSALLSAPPFRSTGPHSVVQVLEADLMGEIPHMIKNIPGVISFLSLTKGGDPVPMRKSEVNRMLGKMDELSEFAVDVEIPFVVGENVKVIDGPFNGFNGSIEKIHEDKKKLEVKVRIFGRETS